MTYQTKSLTVTCQCDPPLSEVIGWCVCVCPPIIIITYETWTLFRGTGPITVKLSKKNHCIADTFIADDVMEDTVFLVPREKFKPNLFSIAGTPHFLWKIKINCYFFSKCFYLTHFSTLHLVSYLISLNPSFLSQVVTLQSRELRVSQ